MFQIDSIGHKLLSLLDYDQKSWSSEYNRSLSLLKTYKLDALLTACHVCYTSIFDCAARDVLVKKWLKCLNNPSQSHLEDFKLNK